MEKKEEPNQDSGLEFFRNLVHANIQYNGLKWWETEWYKEWERLFRQIECNK